MKQLTDANPIHPQFGLFNEHECDVYATGNFNSIVPTAKNKVATRQRETESARA